MATVRTSEPKPNPPWPPEGGTPRPVHADETLETIAAEIAKKRGEDFSWQDLTQFNFGTADFKEVNWCLHKYIGCTDVVRRNYAFSNEDKPGLIYIPPVQVPVPDPPSSSPPPPDKKKVYVPRQHGQSMCKATIGSRCPCLEDYIAVVKKMEQSFPRKITVFAFVGRVDISPTDMVTGLRCLWNKGSYDDWKWDRMLPDANTLSSLFKISVLFPPHETKLFSTRERKLLSGIHCLRTPQHGCIDFGHVLTGVDGSNHPNAGWGVGELDTPAKVIAGVTWSGDLGSVYRAAGGNKWAKAPGSIKDGGRFRLNYTEARGLTQVRFETLWNGRASLDDLLGDVDGVVLGNHFDPNIPFSEQLTKYYKRTQKHIFASFEIIANMKVKGRVQKMTWAWVNARGIGTQARAQWLLDKLANRFLQFVKDGKVGMAKNNCKS